jgi:DNA-binding MarR family transcriptional regulator
VPGVEEQDAAALARELPVLGSVSRVMRRAVRRRFPLPALSDAQVAVLRTVQSHPGTGSGAVASRLQLAASTVSTLVRELVDAGLVLREVDTRDRRASRLWLTDQAHDGLALWASVREEVLVAAVARLTDEERRALSHALPAVRRLVAALETGHDPDLPAPG